MEEGAEDIVSRLVEAVFDEMVAPGYKPGRAEEPQRHIAPDPLLGGQRSGESFTLGAEKAGELVGVSEVRGDGRIRPFFVRADQRGKGIARRMFPVAGEGPRRAGPHPAAITANSSPRAVLIHESLVFSVALPEQVKKGIRHTPMTHRIRQPGQKGRACPPIPPSQTLCPLIARLKYNVLAHPRPVQDDTLRVFQQENKRLEEGVDHGFDERR